MKTKFNFYKTLAALAIICLFGLGSCKKYLSPAPLSTFDPSVVFGNLANAKAAVLGAYNDMEGDQTYGIRVSLYYPYDSDEMMGASGTGDNDRRDIAHYSLTPGNAQLFSPFNQLYQGVERANNCIYYIPKMDLYTNGTAIQKGQLQRMYGEALTLRAQYYFELIRNWGDIPVQWLPSALLPTPYLAKTDRDTIYNQLIADLAVAETLVPWRTDLSTIGDVWDQRFTKGSVKALRAKLAMFRGGYSLRIATKQMERRSDYLTYYAIAKQECSDLMARRDNNTLNPSYKAVFKNSICARLGTDPYGEIMMRVGMASGTQTDSKLGTYNGTKVNGVGSSTLGILPTYFYMFDSTDLRRDVTAVPYEITFDTVKLGHPITTIVDGKFRKEWASSPNLYFSAGIGKTSFTPISNASLGNLEYDWPLIRFSDVLLMYAEADNEINGAPSAAGVSAVNEVSLRAHGGVQALVPTIPTTHDAFFQYLVKERLLEFGGEGIRKYDLIRWNLLTPALAQTINNLKSMATTTPVFTPFTYMAAPPSYVTTSGNFPASMYFKTVNGGANGYPSSNPTNDEYQVFSNSYYKAAPTATPTGNTKVAWMANTAITTSFVAYYGIGYVDGKSELYPFPQQAIDANFNLVQNPGY